MSNEPKVTVDIADNAWLTVGDQTTQLDWAAEWVPLGRGLGSALCAVALPTPDQVQAVVAHWTPADDEEVCLRMSEDDVRRWMSREIASEVSDLEEVA